ncbi:hypothetical protein M5689_023793 [Euphorbia peplus]|nr:hypothetical protein M5689_023793 [Euphorbia peplus]
MTGRADKAVTHKTKKENSRILPTKKENLWPDLPQQLINLIATNSSMMKDLYSKGVTKSWRTEISRKCRSNSLAPPWLDLSTVYGSGHSICHTFNIPFKVGSFWYCCRERPNLATSSHFLGCSQGLLVAKVASDSADYSIWEAYPKSGGWWNIPSWDAEVPFLSAALSSFPLTIENRRTKKAKSIVMVLTGISRPAFLYYRIWEGQEGWMKKDSTIVDPYCSDPSQRDHFIRFCNGIWFKEKFYALSLQGTIAVIEDIDSELIITSIGKRVVPSIASMHYRECMIEFGGMVLIVFLISRNNINKVDFVEVYQFNTDELTWTKKENLGNFTVFLSVHCCVGVSAKRVGCRTNCVYFSICFSNGWYVYDMETCIITPTKFQDWVDRELEGS